METTSMPAAADASSSSPLDLRHAPLLLFDDHGEGKATDGGGMFLLYSIPSKQVLRRRVSEMKDHRYWTTPQGWVLMAARGGAVTFLWDPFTGARISLPPDREGFLGGDDGLKSKRCLLSCKSLVHHHRPSRSCLVLVVDLADTVLWYCRLGVGDGEDVDRQWLKHEYGTVDGMSHLGWSLTSVGDEFLMDLVWTDRVVTLEFSPEPQFTVIPVEAVDRDRWPWPPHNGTSKYAWVESQGCLFCVRFCYSDHSLGNCSIVSVEVSKLDLSARAWAKVGTLEGRAFLLVHPQFGASLDPHEAGSGLKGDCIYYCMPDDDALHVYDMGRGTTSWGNPGPYIGDHCSTKVLMPTTLLIN
jgi:hypothetical protein